LNLRHQFSRMLVLQDAAIERGDTKGATQAAAQIAKLLELIGRAVRELQGHQTINITQTVSNLVLSESYHRVRSAIIDGLADFPQARASVLARLREIETADAAPAESPAPALKLINGSRDD
jgi:hypothetical protein